VSCIGGVRFNEPFDGWMKGSIKRIREAIPDKALDAERNRQSLGIQQSLIA